MAPLKIALLGVLGIGVAASLAFADHQPNHQGGGDTGAAPAGYALMKCFTIIISADPEQNQIGGAILAVKNLGDPGDPEGYSPYIVQSGGNNVVVDEDDTCDQVVENFLAAGWRLQSIKPLQGDDSNRTRFYHFVSP